MVGRQTKHRTAALSQCRQYFRNIRAVRKSGPIARQPARATVDSIHTPTPWRGLVQFRHVASFRSGLSDSHVAILRPLLCNRRNEADVRLFSPCLSLRVISPLFDVLFSWIESFELDLTRISRRGKSATPRREETTES